MEYDPRIEPTVLGASSLPVLPWKSWRIVQVIGSGNFGTVYEAVKVGGAFDERSAIKHIRVPKNSGDIQEGMQQGLFSTDSGARLYYAKTKERIVNEIRLMQKFSGHSHIVNYHDYEIVERQDVPGFDIFIRMERLQPLPEYLRGMGASDTETAVLKLGLDISDALMALHQYKIIHRDIKPANILRGETGFKLADFGVARSLESTGSITLAGTPGYMSPEIYRHFDNVDHTSDIYSLGLVMYRLLNDNRMPFLPTNRDIVIDENMQTEAMGRRMKGEPLPPIPGVSPVFMGIIIKACSFEAKDRYQKAGEMFEALEQLNRRQAVPPKAQLAVSKTGALTKAMGNCVEALAEAGDTITYTITLKNTGNVTVTDVFLADSNHDAFQTMKALVIQAGETVEIGYPYLVTKDDIRKADIRNRITVTGKSPSGAAVSATDEHTLRVTAARPLLTAKCLYQLHKAEGNLQAQAAEIGDTVEYAVTVTNAGNMEVDQIRLNSGNQRMNTILNGTIFNLKPSEKWIGSFQREVDDGELTSAVLSCSITASGLSGDGSQVTAKGDCSVPVYSGKQNRQRLLILSIAAILVGLGIIVYFGFGKIQWMNQPSVQTSNPVLTATPVTTPIDTLLTKNTPANTHTPKVGIAMPDNYHQRWNQDGKNMKAQLEAAGFTVDLQYANDDVATQVSQLENMISNGAQVLVVASIDIDGGTLGTVLSTAKEAGIPIIAYDHLLTNTDAVDYYITFDNYCIGQMQGQYVIDRFNLSNEAVTGPFTVEFTAYSADANKANLVFNGAYNLLKPYLDSGKLVCTSGQTQFEAVNSPIAQARMDMILSCYYADALTGGTKLDICLCANDAAALGVTQSLVNAGFTAENIPVITGLDCDIANIKDIIAGLQAMSVFKDSRILVAQTVKMVSDILAGTAPETNATYANGVKDVESYSCTPLFVDASNYKELLIDSNYYTEDQINAAESAAREKKTESQGNTCKYFLLEEGTAKITGCTGAASSLRIPDRLDGHTVTHIGDNAVNQCSLTGVTTPGRVTCIGDNAFFAARASKACRSRTA